MKKLYLKKILCVLAVGLFVVAGGIFSAMASSAKAMAEETEEDFLSVCEEYTNRESFIGSDGKEHTIEEFAENVSKTTNGPIADLDKVIPEQCLKDAPAGTTYQYCGSVYGFVTHHFEYTIQITDAYRAIQVLIYQVTDEPETNEPEANQRCIQIRQLCSANFSPKYTEETPTYIVRETEVKNYLHIANVGLSNYLFNENDLNYGDSNYNKQRDRGVFIQQTRLNYRGKIVVPGSSTGGDVVKFAADTAIGCIPIIGDMYGALNSASEFSEILVNFASKQEEIVRDNEMNIFTTPSRDTQLTDDSFKSLIRASMVRPKEELYLCDADYVNCYVLLSDTIPACRLYQMVSFNVASVYHDVFTTHIDEYLFSDDDCISVTHAHKLFPNEEYKPVELETDTFAYSIVGGEDRFSFTPKVSGTYQITASGKVGVQAEILNAQNVTANGTNNVLTAYLEAGTCYRLRVFSTSQFGEYKLKIKLRDFESGQSYSIKPSGDTYKLRCSRSGAYAISSDNSNIAYDLYDEQFNKLESFTGDFEYYFDASKTYFLSVRNQTGTEQNCTVTMAPVRAFELDQSVGGIGNGTWKWYRISLPKSGNYTLSVSRVEGVDFKDAIILSQKNFSSGKTVIDFTASAGQEIYIGIKFNGNYTFQISETVSVYQWVVDGETLDSNVAYLQRGTMHSIYLSLDGENLNDAELFSVNGNYCNFYNHTLEIERTCPLSNSSNTQTLLEVEQKELSLTLYVFVLHDIFMSSLTTYHEENAYGLEWGQQSCSFDIQYTVTVDNVERTGTVSATSLRLNILPIVEEIKSGLGFSLVEINSLNVGGTYIYNTEAYGYNDLTDQQKLQNISIPSKSMSTLFGDGTGIGSNPYQISTKRHLNNIRYAKKLVYMGTTSSYYITDSFILTKSLTYNNWVPIETPFKGTFDGGTYFLTFTTKIPDAAFSEPKDFGFFELVSSGGKVKNVWFKDCNISSNDVNQLGGEYANVGILAGSTYEATITDNLFLNCQITCNRHYSWVGGIVGFQAYGRITGCQFNGTIETIGNSVGGIIGCGSSAAVENCYSSATIKWTCKNVSNYAFCIGGLAGYNDYGSIRNSKFDGRISNLTPKNGTTSFQPCMGKILGGQYGGTLSGNQYGNCTFDIGALQKKAGFLGIGKIDQQKYAAGNEVGRVFTDSPVFNPKSTNYAVDYDEVDEGQHLAALIEQIERRRNTYYETGD